MHDNLIESYQNIINHQIMPFMLKQMNISDWEIDLIPPQEKTEEIDLSVEKLRIENAVQMLQLGYEPIKEKGKEIRFKFKKVEQQPGMIPGAPGQPPTPGMLGASPDGGMPPPPGGAPPAPAGGGGGLPAEVDQLPTPPPIEGPEATEGGDTPQDAEEINPDIAEEELDEEEANESGDT
jgi:hypothetical protein